MNKSALALLFAALLVAGVMATPRTLQNDNDKAAEAAEHFRILEELEQVHQLRERMLQEAGTYTSSSAPAPAPSGSSGYATPGMPEGEEGFAGSGSEP